MPLIRKGVASGVNALVWLGIDRATQSLNTLTVIIFFLYVYGTDIVCGRCLGMMLAGTGWKGKPTWQQKLVYSLSYTICFALFFASLWIALVIAAAQVLAITLTGLTTHGLLARLDSGPLANTSK
jgi:hypothetical protein